MKNGKMILIGVCIGILLCATLIGIIKLPNSPAENMMFQSENVSMLQLITTPEKYDGKLVRVIGVGNLEFEGNALYFSKEDLLYRVGNALWLELDEDAVSYEEAQAFNGEYVIVEGVFDKDDSGHMGIFFGAIHDVRRYDLWNLYQYYDITNSIHLTRNDDLTYTYSITDKRGNILFAQEDTPREPKFSQVRTDILEVSVQAGIGLSTNWAVYCNVETGKVSETFTYVVAAQGEYVVYVQRKNGTPCIIVQNIFSDDLYYQIHTLEDAASDTADFITGSGVHGEGVVLLTYLTDQDHAEKELTIRFP